MRDSFSWKCCYLLNRETSLRGNASLLGTRRRPWRSRARYGLLSVVLFALLFVHAGRLHGKRHGFGKYQYLDGGRFEGEWVDDRIQGKGKSIYANGNVYDGACYPQRV